MNDSTYSGFSIKAQKQNVSAQHFNNNISLEQLSSSQYVVADQKKIIKALCNDLKELLDCETIHQIIEGIFEIENNLANIAEESGEMAPSLSDFHKNLSPILLRSLWENASTSDEPGKVIKGWKEALRIAIEEELYIWQDRMVERFPLSRN